MAITINEQDIARASHAYRTKMRDAPFDLYKHLSSGRSEFMQSQQSGNNRAVIDGLEKFFTIYGLVRTYAAKKGPTEFSENFGIYCGSAYSDAFLANQTSKSANMRAINLAVKGSEYLLIANALELFGNATSRASPRELPKIARGFLKGINQGAEQSLNKFPQSLEDISREAIKIGKITFRGLDYEGKKDSARETVKNKRKKSKGWTEKNAEKDDEIKESLPALFEKVGFDDVGGNFEAKKAAKDVIEDMKDAESLEYVNLPPVKGLLFYGPPGTGKTMLARAIATAIDRQVYEVRVDKVLDKWLGNSEKALAELLDKKNSVLIFDEFGSIGRKTDEAHEITGRLTDLLATRIEGLSNNSNLITATTNSPCSIDPKLISRFNYVVHCGVPDTNELREIFVKQLSNSAQQSVAWKEHKNNLFENVQVDKVTNALYRRSRELENGGYVGIVGRDVRDIISKALRKIVGEFRSRNGSSLQDRIDFFRRRKLKTQDFLEQIASFNKRVLWLPDYAKDAFQEET